MKVTNQTRVKEHRVGELTQFVVNGEIYAITHYLCGELMGVKLGDEIEDNRAPLYTLWHHIEGDEWTTETTGWVDVNGLAEMARDVENVADALGRVSCRLMEIMADDRFKSKAFEMMNELYGLSHEMKHTR